MPVPLHYDITGEVTRWGEPSSLWTSSVLALLVYLLLSALQKYPGVLNYPVKVTPDNAKGLYALGMDLVRGLKLLLTLLFAYTGHVTFAVAVGKGMRMSAFVIAAWLCLLVILLVTYWIKMQKLKLRP